MAEMMTASELRRRADAEAEALGLPEETEISYPVPVRGDRLTAAFFASFASRTPDGRNFALHRPAARIELDWNDGSVVSASVRDDVVPVDEDRPIGLARTAEFEGPPFGDEEERGREVEAELLSALDRVAPAYGSGSDDAGQRAACLGLFRRLVPEPILAVYEELNPDFFRWLGEGPAPVEPTSWAPTHDVPPDGMPAWGTPDPSAPAVANLDPGLPLQVVATAGDWAQVVASNGWTGWVDGRRLVPRR